jgi:PAS domain S-box-containing protein
MCASNGAEREHAGQEQQDKPRGRSGNDGFLNPLIRCIPNVILFLSPDRRIIEFNREAERLYGRKRANVLGKDYLELFVPDDARETAAANIDRVLAGENVREFENAVIAYDGQEHTLNWNVTRALDSDDRPVGIVAVGQDITERKKTYVALRESQKKFRSFIAHIPDVVWTADDKGRTVFVSPNVEEVCGYTPEKICQEGGRLWFERIHPDDVERVRESLQAVFTKGVPLDIEYRIRRKDDEWIWIKDRSIRSYKEDGVEYADGVFSDITERKLAEEALRRERKLNEEFFKTTPAFASAINSEGKLVMMNDAMCNALGYTFDEIEGADYLTTFVPERDREKLAEVFRVLATTRESTVSDNHILTKDGRELLVEWHGSQIFDLEDQFDFLFGIGIDITEREQGEKALRESQEKFHKAFRSSPSAVTISTLETGRFIAANEAATRLFGHSNDQIIGRTSAELGIWSDLKDRDRMVEVLESDGKTRDYEVQFLHKSGDVKDVILSAEIIELEGEACIILATTDITSRKETERRIQEYQAQLKSLASELSLAEERERRRIAAGLHDDIAQKLAMAKFGLQSLRASVSDPEVSGSLDEQCQLMNQVVEDARSLTFELSNPILYQIGLEAAVEWYVAERIRGQFGIACKFTSEGVRSNPGEDIKVVLFQAVRELLANVVKHANASAIDVLIVNTEDGLKLVVEDDGVGFDPTRIGPYPKQHSGFGLFNIKERLEYLGGNLKIESWPRKGVRITMTVPVGTETVDKRKEALL